ncbi:hypothetical protein [Roseivirga sp.]|uniref:hypothetical protein n=1 Tax=Roseivirga sp. TaxID=1964215 RepID=UPI003BAC5203
MKKRQTCMIWIGLLTGFLAVQAFSSSWLKETDLQFLYDSKTYKTLQFLNKRKGELHSIIETSGKISCWLTILKTN